MVHEARGLDVNPSTIQKFRVAKDDLSVKVLEIIHREEVTHVAAGCRWFNDICDLIPDAENMAIQYDVEDADRGEDIKIRRFQALVRQFFRGRLKPPFNAKDRQAAGLSAKWYEPLSV
jgi:uncharacterized ferritin-like protein (DUF455 family)